MSSIQPVDVLAVALLLLAVLLSAGVDTVVALFRAWQWIKRKWQ